MKIIAPNYYSDFACTADKCVHNCCIGWEIDIDDKTYKYYTSVCSSFGKRLMDGISTEDGVPHFKLSSNERCLFLNSENLCDIIINLGEENLCQICADHPRFRNFYGDRTEMGLGLSCEAAARLILMNKNKVKFDVIKNDCENAVMYEEEQSFFALREKIFDIVQNREKPISERILEIEARCGIKISSISSDEWLNLYMSLERLDPAWTQMLIKLSYTNMINDTIFNSSEWDIVFEQLLMYFLYRHMADGIYDGTLIPHISFAVHAMRMIRKLGLIFASENGAITIDEIADIARMYSAEIEYSEVNMNSIIDFLKQKGRL